MNNQNITMKNLQKTYQRRKCTVVTRKQKGATLFTALIFLALMTIVSVSATKISIQDVLISGNNEQQMRIFQTTENTLKILTTVVALYPPLTGEGGAAFSPTSGIYMVTDTTKPHAEQQIRDFDKQYQCGGFSGKALSIGPGVSPCDLYDFQVKSNLTNSGVRDRHNRGAGKEKPKAGSKNSYL